MTRERNNDRRLCGAFYRATVLIEERQTNQAVRLLEKVDVSLWPDIEPGTYGDVLDLRIKLRKAQAYNRSGRPDLARRQAHELLQRVSHPSGGGIPADARRDLTQALAGLFSTLGEHETACSLTEALLDGEEPPDVAPTQVSIVRNNLGYRLVRLGFELECQATLLEPADREARLKTPPGKRARKIYDEAVNHLGIEVDRRDRLGGLAVIRPTASSLVAMSNHLRARARLAAFVDDDQSLIELESEAEYLVRVTRDHQQTASGEHAIRLATLGLILLHRARRTGERAMAIRACALLARPHEEVYGSDEDVSAGDLLDYGDACWSAGRHDEARTVYESGAILLERHCGAKYAPCRLLRALASRRSLEAISGEFPNDAQTKRSTHELLGSREASGVEFKATARYNLETHQKDPKIEHEIAKTIAAFANAKGGTLLIGVSDNGEPVGLTNDYKLMGNRKNADGFGLWLTNFLDSSIGLPTTVSLKVSIEDVGGKDVCRVDVPASHRPVYVKPAGSTKDEFYVRSGNSSRQLTTQQFAQYQRDRWPS